MGWAVKLHKKIDFKGRQAVADQHENGVGKMLACFTVDDPNIELMGRETIYRNGERVGWLTSGGYGYTVEKSIGYGYVRHAKGVDRAFVLDGSYELEVATERVPCNVHMASLYDPKMQKVKC